MKIPRFRDDPGVAGMTGAVVGGLAALQRAAHFVGAVEGFGEQVVR